MNIEFDPKKRELNYTKHGVDFLKAALIFSQPTLTVLDSRKDYGEQRFISMGMADGELLVVVHTDRNTNIRIISAWKGGGKEHEKYEEFLTRRDTEEI